MCLNGGTGNFKPLMSDEPSGYSITHYSSQTHTCKLADREATQGSQSLFQVVRPHSLTNEKSFVLILRVNVSDGLEEEVMEKHAL